MLPRDWSKNTSYIFVHFSIDYILLFSKPFSSLVIESTSLICNNSLLPTFLAFFSYSTWMCYYHYPAWGWCNELQYLCYSFSAKVVLKILKERGIAHNTSCIINFRVAAVCSIRVVYTLCSIAINHRRKSTTYICIRTYIARVAIVFFSSSNGLFLEVTPISLFLIAQCSFEPVYVISLQCQCVNGFLGQQCKDNDVHIFNWCLFLRR